MIPWKISINLMWWGWGAGFRLVVNFGLLSLTFLTSRKRSGGFWSIRSYILTSGFGPVAPEPSPHIADMETWISVGLSIFGSGRASVSGRISTSGIAAELQPPHVWVCVWPNDHWRGRFYATFVTRKRHHGRRISFPGRPLRSRLARQVAATYVTWFPWLSPEIRHLLDSESMLMPDKIG